MHFNTDREIFAKRSTPGLLRGKRGDSGDPVVVDHVGESGMRSQTGGGDETFGHKTSGHHY